MYTFETMYHLVTTINRKNKNTVFSIETLKDELIILAELANSLNLDYYNHGGSCLCFVDKTYENVYKLVKLGSSLDVFMGLVDTLKTDNVPHLEILEVLYRNPEKNVLIYKQKFCKSICNINVNDKFMAEYCAFLKNMMGMHVFIPDTFYKNFCIYENKLVIYDFHDITNIENVKDSELDFFYVNLLLNIRTYFNADDETSDITELEKNVDNKFYIQSSVIKNKMLSRNVSAITKMFDILEVYFRSCVEKEYNIYQHIKINKQGELLLFDHTAQKFEFAERLTTLENFSKTTPYTLLDAGCCIGGISLKMAQKYSNISVLCNNITKTELSVCKEIANKCHILKHQICDINIVDVQKQFDFTMYFAIIHHLLKSMSFNSVIDMVLRQTKSYTIIELPVRGDKLLDMVIRDAQNDRKIDYLHLDTIRTLLDKLSEKMEVIYYKQIDYGTPDLIRYAILLKKKN